MQEIKTYNKIAKIGLSLFDDKYEISSESSAPVGALVRSASLHNESFPETLLAIARAGAGTNNIPTDLLTEKGVCVAENLSSDVLSSILDKSLAAAFRYLDFKSRGIEAKCRTEKREEGVFEVQCQLLERGKVIFSNVLTVDSADRARRMADNFRDRPEVIYRGVHALLAGNMNFLFD